MIFIKEYCSRNNKNVIKTPVLGLLQFSQLMVQVVQESTLCYDTGQIHQQTFKWALIDTL